MKWIKDNTIYVTLHGSQCYGLNNDLSDCDVKGIVIPPKDVEYNLFHRFDQAENNIDIETQFSYLKNPKNPKFESTIYSLRKFVQLAAEVNPSIIELLYTDTKHHLFKHPIMEKLLENRNIFLSNRVRFTYSGYAISQIKKIERHRKWIVMGEVKYPTREEYGLPPEKPNGMGDISGYIKSEVEKWNLNQFPMDEMTRSDFKNVIWELLSNVTKREFSVANWPDKYSDAVMYKLQNQFNLKDEVVNYIYAERSYSKAKQLYDSWCSWKNERNPERRKLEEKYQVDTKHLSHTVRLLRTALEILTTGRVNVNREGIDADELKSIKNGGWTYEQGVEYANMIESKLNDEYIRQKQLIVDGKSTPLPQNVNKEKINSLYHELYENYWNGSKHNPEYNHDDCMNNAFGSQS